MMSQIDTLKDQAWTACGIKDWHKLSEILGLLAPLWTDVKAAQRFYTEMADAARAAREAPNSITDSLKRMKLMTATTAAAIAAGTGAPTRAPRTLPNLTEPKAPKVAKVAKLTPTSPGKMPKRAAAQGQPAADAASPLPRQTRKTKAPATKAPEPATKAPAAPKAAKPAATGKVRFAYIVTANLRRMLSPHGFELIEAPARNQVAFAKGNVGVVVTIPDKAGAPGQFVVTKGKNITSGVGRVALAEQLGVPWTKSIGSTKKS